MIKNKKINNILQYIFVILLILETNSIYSQIYGIHLYIRMAIIITSIIIILIFILNKETVIYKTILKFIIYDLICSSVLMINTNNFNGKIIILLVFILYLPLCLIYLSNLSKENLMELLKKFVNVVIILCLMSLFFWSMSSIFNVLKPTGTLNVVWAKPYSIFDNFFYLHFNIYTQDVWWITGFPLARNTGIYTEGPMYAFILIIALLFNNLLCYEHNRSNLIKTIILFVTMLSTISVTGITCAVIIIILNFLINIKNKKKTLLSLICMMIICIFMLPLGINIFNKKLQTGSAKHRNLDIKNGIETFMESPIIGKGILHERPTENEFEIGYGYSNTIVPVLTDGGILLGIIYIFPAIALLYRSFKENKNERRKHLILILIYDIILFTTLVQYRLSLMFLISIIYCQQLKMKENLKSQKFLLGE